MSSSAKTCQNCGCCELESDPSRGDTYCTKCGTVLEENAIVSEVQFEESGGGGSHVVGQMVTESSSAGTGGFKGLSMGGIGSGKESRQITLENAQRRIRSVGAQLRINQHCIDMSFTFYKMALTQRLTHGRKHTHVIAACIYITCRLENTSHMLLDLSDVTQVNVYELGRTYLRLSAALHIHIPAIDPCIYIVRFAHKLELGEKRHQIEMTALRLVQRMKRDWMHTGRRPSGLCGAALYVAARYNEHQVSIKDIIKIVRVCETTIRKRLSEFGETPSSRLSYEEFMNIDLEAEEDPPCFKEARKKKQGQIEFPKEAEVEIEDLKERIEKELEKSRKKLRGPYAKFANESGASTPAPSEPATPSRPSSPAKPAAGAVNSVDENQILSDFIVQETLGTIENFLKEGEGASNTPDEQTLSQKYYGLRPAAMILHKDKDQPREAQPDKESKTPSTHILTETIDDDQSEPTINDEKMVPPKTDEDAREDDPPLDDDEIMSYIRTEDEVKSISHIWHQHYADFLEEERQKEEQKRLEEEERKAKEEAGEIEPPKKRRKTRRSMKNAPPASTVNEAVEKMLQGKKLSSKINYDALKDLELSTPPGSVRNSIKPELKEESSPLPIQRRIVSSVKRLPSLRDIINAPLRTPESRTPLPIKTVNAGTPLVKRPFSISNTSPLKVSPLAQPSSSGMENKSSQPEEEDDDDDDEEEEEEEEVNESAAGVLDASQFEMSAAQMIMGRNDEGDLACYGDNDGYYDEDY